MAIELAFATIALFHQCLLNKDFTRFLRCDLTIDAIFVFNNTQAKQCLTLFGHDLTGFFIVKGFAIALFHQVRSKRFEPVGVNFGDGKGELLGGFHQRASHQPLWRLFT